MPLNSSAVPILNPATANHSDVLLLCLHVAGCVTLESVVTEEVHPYIMSSFTRFNHYFFHALSKIRGIVFGLFAWLVVNAAAIAYFEKLPFADAL